MHLGLTSNDVWDTATSLQLRDAAALLQTELARLEAVLVAKAQEHKRTLMVGRTHGIHAEPMTFGLLLALWVDEVRRGRTRLTAATASISVGKISGAVGTHATVPPSAEERICAELGLGVAPVSNQILQRDRHAEFVSTLALIAASLEKFAVQIRHMQRTELREAEEPFLPGQTGSSAMPHKRNPEKCERISGLARVIRGYATTALENVALWHETRHLALVYGAHHLPRRLHPARLHARHVQLDHGEPGRLSGAHAREHGSLLRARLLAARAAGARRAAACPASRPTSSCRPTR